MTSLSHPFIKVMPGQTLGILGGGQLGRMLSLAAASLGIQTLILTPEEDSPAGMVATDCIHAPYCDADALDEFIRRCSVITFEFENIPLEVAEYIAARKPLYPHPRCLAITQDRLSERTFLGALGLPFADYTPITYEGDIREGVGKLGLPAVLKTRRMGYDGKGQTILHDTNYFDAYQKVQEAPSILEKFIPFEREVSVIIARSIEGKCFVYDVTDNMTQNHILVQSQVPSTLSQELQNKAIEIAHKIVDALEYVGVMGVEFFITTDGQILVNELAPRVHNTGHWTLDACQHSQFEQHVRAVCGWPLGEPHRHSNAVMMNLLGDEITSWSDLACDSRVSLHLYGKKDIREGRKMGHITQLSKISI
jgi:5-(carboxyamino)imidazole ribonucleotide synthase